MKIKQSINKKALMIATFSFLIGTVILLAYLIYPLGQTIIVGIFYILIALVLNGITLLGLIANSIINSQYNKENLQTILVFLLNIPIAFGYLSIVILNPFNSLFIS